MYNYIDDLIVYTPSILLLDMPLYHCSCSHVFSLHADSAFSLFTQIDKSVMHNLFLFVYPPCISSLSLLNPICLLSLTPSRTCSPCLQFALSSYVVNGPEVFSATLLCCQDESISIYSELNQMTSTTSTPFFCIFLCVVFALLESLSAALPLWQATSAMHYKTVGFFRTLSGYAESVQFCLPLAELFHVFLFC